MASRKDRNERDKWVQFYQLLAASHPSPLQKEARAIVFGSELGATLSTVAQLRPTSAKFVRDSLASASRQVSLETFRMKHAGMTDAAIYRPLKIDRRDFTRWKKGELPDTSEMSKRITRVVCGETSTPH